MAKYAGFFQQIQQPSTPEKAKKAASSDSTVFASKLEELLRSTEVKLGRIYTNVKVFQGKPNATAEDRENLTIITESMASSKHEVQNLNAEIVDIASHQELKIS